MNTTELEIWFVTGSQHLYGPAALKQVAANSQKVVESMNASGRLPHKLVFKPVVTTPDEVTALCTEANSAPNCAGIVAWMHTFSPAKMWIAGLQLLRKPLADLHTQFNRDLPWSTIDMDFMNLNQTAHGGREFGHIGARLRLPRKVVVGHWDDPEVAARLAAWMRAARAWHDCQGMKIARFGDNMRQVAVTDGDKVSAQMKFGWSVNGYGVGDLVAMVNAATRRRDRRPLRRIRRHLHRRRRPAPGWRETPVAARCRPHRTRPARVPQGRRLQRHSPPRSRTCMD